LVLGAPGGAAQLDPPQGPGLGLGGGASPALLMFTPNHSPLCGLARRLSTRWRAARLPYTASRGQTPDGMPISVRMDGISFTVHP